MAKQSLTPVDHLTNMPLPIAPHPRYLPLHNPDVADWHHHFHPRSDPHLQTVGGIALRNSRIQLVPREFHNEGPMRYHKFFEGPPIPESEALQFGMCVLACAGYIPKQAIDLSAGEPKIIRLKGMRRSVLLSRGSKEFDYQYIRYAYDPIREFFAKYVIEQDLAELLPERTIDEFLYSRDVLRRQQLGKHILTVAANSATEAINPIYSMLRRRQLLPDFMPPDPHTLVVSKLGKPEHQEEVILPRLKRQLRQLVAA